MWDEDRLQFVRGNSEKHGAADEILQHHNMTAEHVEILGQFLDMTGQTPERLKAILRTAFARLDGDRRLFEVKMTHNGRTVTITYDPSDTEAVKTAETWRKALFAEPGDAAKPDRMTELEKVAKPLRDYLKTHGDPHTSVIVTRDGATETQDERRVTFRDCLNRAVADERYDLKALNFGKI